MDIIILCGGFGVRFPMSPEKPKALLEVAGKPLVEHIAEKVCGLAGKVYVSTNRRFEPDFRRWLESYRNPKIEIVVESATTQDEKLGAIGALRFVVESKGVSGDIMVINGDNIFEDSLAPAMSRFRKEGAALVCLHRVPTTEDAKPFGVAETLPDGTVIGFEEKPERPTTNTISTGIYLFPWKSVQRISEYLDTGESPDQPGNFLKWLHTRERVVGVMLEGNWFDVGNAKAYAEAKDAFERDSAQ